MVFVLFTYGGWNEMAYVAAEIKDPRRNIVRALVIGSCAVIGLYLLLNIAFLHVLGYNGLVVSKAVAADVVAGVLPGWSASAIAILICVSALGAVNGLIFTGARISYALGQEHPTFRPLSEWNPLTGTPILALLVQGLIAMVMIILLRSYMDTLIYSAIAVYGFYLATNLSVIVLRFRQPAAERPYRVTGYPITTLIFCGVCGYLVYNCVNYARAVKPNSLIVLLCTFILGIVLFIIDSLIRRKTIQ
jgi:amino acid transporter